MQRGADALTDRVVDGRYRIDARIARGGMATVYRAHDLRLNRPCAVKVMHAEGDQDLGEFAARFVREAHAAARLSHPNVVAVTDQGDDDGVLFLVMELVDGQTLRDVIRDEAPMDPARALMLLEPVLRALAEAHRSGLVHRDVKPENVLIDDEDRVKVADFGLARAFDTQTQHTATGGLLIGTVSYLAPELIVDGRADPRSDVYAAGVLLFEMLTGRKPHEGEGAIQIAFKHVNEDVPPPSSVPRGSRAPLPAYLDALVLRATARERERRPADAQVMLQQVRRVRAAVEAGDLDDPELTADLLPPMVAHGTEELEIPDEPVPAPSPAPNPAPNPAPSAAPTLVAPPAGGPTDLPTVESDEPTTVIAAAGDPALVGTTARSVSSAGVRESTGALRAGTGDRAVPPGGSPGSRSGGAGVPPPPGSPPRRRSTPPGGVRVRRGPLLLLVVVLLTALVAYLGWWFGIGRYTSTPGIVNLPVAAATDKLASAGLDLEVAKRDYSETVTAGSVISTDPAAGDRILEGGSVQVVVSRGPERYAVPDLVGSQLSEVESKLEADHLSLGTVSRVWHEKVPSDVVISSSPNAGTELHRDDTVDVTVSKGREPLEIPDLTGRDAEKAQQRLTKIGFDVEVTERHDAEVPEGDVIRQSPSSGTGHRGDEISLVVSLGPVMVEVPRLGTRSVADATAALEDAGLRIAVERTDLYVGLDRVVRQSPGTGESVPEGSVVTVYIV